MPSSAQQQQQQDELKRKEGVILQKFVNERPTMDTAVKSFLSLTCARIVTTSATDSITTASQQQQQLVNKQQQQTHALQVARIILQSINSYEFPIHTTVLDDLVLCKNKKQMSIQQQERIMELSIVARLWNGLIVVPTSTTTTTTTTATTTSSSTANKNKPKPSKFLGRRALQYAWKDLRVASRLQAPPETSDHDSAAALIIYQQKLEWIQEFERLLFQNVKDTTKTSNAIVKDNKTRKLPCPALSNHSHTHDNDAALIWDSDGGQAELAKRRERRQRAATERALVTPS